MNFSQFIQFNFKTDKTKIPLRQIAQWYLYHLKFSNATTLKKIIQFFLSRHK